MFSFSFLKRPVFSKVPLNDFEDRGGYQDILDSKHIMCEYFSLRKLFWQLWPIEHQWEWVRCKVARREQGASSPLSLLLLSAIPVISRLSPRRHVSHPRQCNLSEIIAREDRISAVGSEEFNEAKQLPFTLHQLPNNWHCPANDIRKRALQIF